MLRLFEKANDQVTTNTGMSEDESLDTDAENERVEHAHNSTEQLRRFEFTDLLVLLA